MGYVLLPIALYQLYVLLAQGSNVEAISEANIGMPESPIQSPRSIPSTLGVDHGAIAERAHHGFRRKLDRA
jgi:hypothetical protein